MPTYDYRCNACGHEFEQFQSMKDATLKKCPKCAKNALERLIGLGGAVIFKGSGFYETDYRSDSYKKAADADKKSGEHVHTGSCACGAKPAGECAGSSGEAAKSEGKSEPKPEPKAESQPARKQAKKPTKKAAK